MGKAENSNIKELHIDLSLSTKFPLELSEYLETIVIRREKGDLIVATDGSKNRIVQEYLKQYYRYPIKFIKLERGEIRQLRDSIYKVKIYKDNDISEDIVRKLDKIISFAVSEKASDIHFEPFDKGIRIRFRIDGELYIYDKIDMEKYRGLLMRVKILSHLNTTETRIPQDGRMEFIYDNRPIDLRVSILPLIGCEKLVIRILDKESFNFSIEDLGLVPKEIEKFKELIDKNHGMILFTGPAGSGKTTSLYTILNELNLENKNIVSIEDPVEYNFEGINQSQVNYDIGYDFELALESILRQDPDVIMLGEIRSSKVADIAIRSALTGHLMLSSLHTNDGLSAIIRLLSLGIPKDMIISGILGIVSQRLIKKLCPYCKISYEASTLEKIRLGLDRGGNYKFYRSNGCYRCRSGFKGRQLVVEILTFNEDIKKIISISKSIEELKDNYREIREKSLRSSALNHLLEGNVSYEDVIKINI